VTAPFNVIVEPVEIGQFSYVGEFSHISQFTKIGKFCSIGNLCTVGAHKHLIDGLTTSPGPSEFPPTTIGNDVWVGSNSVILAGLTIGTGAIIGAGSVVTHDVPPYAIVAGNSARVLRFRFSDNDIAKLLESKWWDLPLEKLSTLPVNDIGICLEMLGKSDLTVSPH